jgi:type II secretory pathway pseudopilin PulG
MRIRRKRGFTIVEVLLTVGISSLIVGSMALVYGYTMVRTSYAIATTSVSQQVQTLSSEIDSVISQASSTTIITTGGNTGLKCTMPATQVDLDADGILDAYQPTSILGGAPIWGKGKRIWFYTADSTGDFLRPGSVVWRAERSDDLFPTTTTADKSFAYYAGSTTNRRFSLIDQITWVNNTNDKYVTYTLRASTLTRAERSSPTAYGGEKNVAQTLTLTKNVFLRNWRQ